MCLPRSSASDPASDARSLSSSLTGPSFSSSTRVVGSRRPARNPTAAPPIASPSGFSFERPTLRAPSLTSCVSGAASVTVETTERARSVTASFASVTDPLIRPLTSALRPSASIVSLISAFDSSSSS